MNILITSGGTEEPIDGVRSITNISTGRTGALLADRLSEMGADVTLLHGRKAALPKREMKRAPFTSFRDLKTKMEYLLKTGEYHGVVHLAAVSDFSPDYIKTEKGTLIKPQEKGKIPSDGNLTLHLKRNPKILEKIKAYAPENKTPVVVGFKLTNTISMGEMKRAVEKLLHRESVDYIIHNNLPEITEHKHPAAIYASGGELLFQTSTKKEMAEIIHTLIEGAVRR